MTPGEGLEALSNIQTYIEGIRDGLRDDLKRDEQTEADTTNWT